MVVLRPHYMDLTSGPYDIDMKNNLPADRPMARPKTMEYEEDGIPQAALRASLLKSMGKGAAAGCLIGLLLLAAAEAVTKTALSGFSSAMILLGISGWSGMAVYCADLMKRFLED